MHLEQVSEKLDQHEDHFKTSCTLHIIQKNKNNLLASQIANTAKM